MNKEELTLKLNTQRLSHELSVELVLRVARLQPKWFPKMTPIVAASATDGL